MLSQYCDKNINKGCVCLFTGPTNLTQNSGNTSTVVTTTYTLPSGTYFYDAARSFGQQQQQQTFSACSQVAPQVKQTLGAHVQG